MSETLVANSSSTAHARALGQRVSSETHILANEPLAGRTTLRVGGPADLYVEPSSEADLGQVLGFCADRSLPWFVLGRGSNLLVKDRGFRGVVISMVAPAFSRIRVKGLELRCGAGAKLKAVAGQARQQGIAGLEFLEGIPGTIGGALRMNAGAMGSAIFERVTTVRLMDRSGQVREWMAAELAVGYRECSTLRKHIALEAVLRGQPGSPEEIGQKMIEFSERRRRSQPSASSAGCIFKNPAAIPAGKLIEELGLKGRAVGGALVSLEHGNFLINNGTATAADFLKLIELIQRRARTERNIDLETEVEMVGE